MRDTAAALYNFFSSFGLPAFVENNVPDVPNENGEMEEFSPPYITYELREPEPGKQTSLVARVWYLDTGFDAVTRKVDEIKNALRNGASIPTNDGAIWLWMDENFCQFQPPDEPKIKIAYLMLIMGSYKS